MKTQISRWLELILQSTAALSASLLAVSSATAETTRPLNPKAQTAPIGGYRGVSSGSLSKVLGAFIMPPKEPYRPHCDKDFAIHLQQYSVLANSTTPDTMSMDWNWLLLNEKLARQQRRSPCGRGIGSVFAL